jgi:hypothetical protein
MKMKKIVYVLLLSTSLLAMGFATRENNTITLAESFERICLRGNMRVILVQRNNDNVLEYKNGKISAEVHNGELLVKQKNNIFSDDVPVVIIPITQLSAIKIKDDAAVFTQGVIKTNELSIDQRGDGTLKLNIDANKILVCSSGIGKIEIEGNYQQTSAKKETNGCMVIEYRAK